MLPDIVLEEVDGFTIVRDDLLPGGTKRRALPALFDDHQEYVYASPVFGYAQVALAHAARDHDKCATIFCAARKEMAPLTRQAMDAGALIVEVPYGYMSVVKARAFEYCKTHNACLLPFGLDDPRFIAAMADIVRGLDLNPFEVWSAVGSGTLTRSLQAAWPSVDFHGVRVGAEPEAGRATLYVAPEKYEQAARNPPPFPSCKNYDAKVWQFMKQFGHAGALMWNL